MLGADRGIGPDRLLGARATRGGRTQPSGVEFDCYRFAAGRADSSSGEAALCAVKTSPASSLAWRSNTRYCRERRFITRLLVIHRGLGMAGLAGARGCGFVDRGWILRQPALPGSSTDPAHCS